MNKKIKNIIIILVLITIIALIFSYFKPKQIKLLVPVDKNYETEKISIKKIDQNLEKVETKDLNKIKEIKVFLTVLGEKYQTKVNEGESVFEAMKQIKNDKGSLFSFEYKETLGLGAFIQSINGVNGKRGAYWIYYVNGVKASIGASNYILKEGDIINWQQEGSYL